MSKTRVPCHSVACPSTYEVQRRGFEIATPMSKDPAWLRAGELKEDSQTCVDGNVREDHKGRSSRDLTVGERAA